MKTLIFTLSLIFSLNVFAQAPVYPRVINSSFAAIVEIDNHTEQDVYCSGTIYLHTTMSGVEMNFFNERVYAGDRTSRWIHLRNFQDRIIYVNHSIYCR